MPDNRNPDDDRVLSVRLAVHLGQRPITGRLRSDHGEEEEFVGWLGFIDTLRRLDDRDRGRDKPD